MTARAPTLHAGHIQHALVRHLNHFQNRLMPEFGLDGGQCDLVQITKSGYVTEYEIKVSRADWKIDAAKDKWKKPRPHIARFFYVVPEDLADYWPDWAPEGAGLLVVSARRHTDLRSGSERMYRVREHRPAKRFKAKPVPQAVIDRVLEAAYYRFWARTNSIYHERFGRELARAQPVRDEREAREWA